MLIDKKNYLHHNIYVDNMLIMRVNILWIMWKVLWKSVNGALFNVDKLVI